MTDGIDYTGQAGEDDGAIMRLIRTLESESPAQYGMDDPALDEAMHVFRIVKMCADELIAVHNTTGIDVYDRVPGWLGVIHLIYPNWKDEESAYYEGCDYK